MTDFTPETINVADASSPDKSPYLRILAAGERVGMRIWCNEKPGEKSTDMHSHSYETVGYIIEGRATLHFSDDSIDLNPGDSWLVPADAEHRYEILEELTAIEALSPPMT